MDFACILPVKRKLKYKMHVDGRQTPNDPNSLTMALEKDLLRFLLNFDIISCRLFCWRVKMIFNCFFKSPYSLSSNSYFSFHSDDVWLILLFSISLFCSSSNVWSLVILWPSSHALNTEINLLIYQFIYWFSDI